MEWISANLDTSCEVASQLLPCYSTYCWRRIDWWVRTNSYEGEFINYPWHHNVWVVATLPKRVFHRIESSLRRHWPMLTHVLQMVSVEFCV